jgi:hypothetical protein
MKTITVFVLALVMGLALGCASPQDKAYKAQGKVHKERLKLVDEYKKCLQKAGDDKTAIEACDSYLKAAEALK